MAEKLVKIPVPEADCEVSGLVSEAPKAKARLVLAHGAGAGMRHLGLVELTKALTSRGISVLRFQFPYMEKRTGRPDRLPMATATVEAAVKFASRLKPSLPLFAGGKSFGGRMTTNAAALGKISELHGIICFGFPLHPPKKVGVERAEHLAKVSLPILFLQGTRDALADLSLMKKVTAKQKHFHLRVLEGADHSFAVLKSSGRTSGSVLEEIADATAAFCFSH